MDHFDQEDIIDFQRRQPPRNPPPSQRGARPDMGPGSGPGQRPGFGPGPFPGQGPGFGPAPFPGQGPGVGPGSPPEGAPRSAPPNYTPSRQAVPFRVDPFAIRHCLRSFTYVWLNNGEEFWMFPIQVTRNTVIGFRWNRFFGWTFFGVSLNRISSFMCV